MNNKPEVKGETKSRKIHISSSFEEMDQLKYNLSLSLQERLLAHKKLVMKVYAEELKKSKPLERRIYFK
jgi:hypothetical protein